MKRFLLLLFTSAFLSPVFAADRPNVLFIAIDDLNHWVTHLGRNSQAQTPNIDRLAKMGLSFSNAHCAVPACEPSRCALMSGRRPWTSGCYKNGHTWKKYQADGEGLSAQFLNAGYHVAGAGKIYHGMQYREAEWTEYMSTVVLSSNGPGVSKNDGYHNVEDPNEWKNLAGDPELATLKTRLAKWLPKKEAPEKAKGKGKAKGK